MKSKIGKTLVLFFATVSFNQIYYAQTVAIGKQFWMTKNLDVSVFRNGDPIPEAKTNEEWEAAGENKRPAWCYYKNDLANASINGKLYNFYAVSDKRGLAPIGFHLPSLEEWDALINYLGGDGLNWTNTSNKLKSTSNWLMDEYMEENPNGTNSVGFNAQPSGIRESSGYFDGKGKKTIFWTKTPLGSFYAYYKEFAEYPQAGMYYNKNSGFSVRCIKD
jgi:uncharacterized protein (TIGR02145 family)